MRIKKVLYLCCLVFPHLLNAQDRSIDSVTMLIHSGKLHDTSLVKSLNFIGEQVYSYQPDSAIRCWERSHEICERYLSQSLSEEKKKYYITESSLALNNIGYVYQHTGDALRAIKFLKKSLVLSMSIKDYSNVAIALNNIGHNLANIGNNVGALDYYNQSLEVLIKHGTKKEIITSLVIMGDMYSILQDKENAVKYLNKALDLAREISDKRNQAYINTLLGNTYFHFKNYQKALSYDSVSLNIYEELKDQPGIARVYNNRGARYYTLQKFEEALKDFDASLAIRVKLNEVKELHATLVNRGTALLALNRKTEGFEALNRAAELAVEAKDKMLEWQSLLQIANMYLVHGKNHRQSELYAGKALLLAREMGFPDMIRKTSKFLSDNYKSTGNFKKAFEMQSLYMEMHDSLVNSETRKATINSQLKYEYEIKAAADSIRIAADKKLNEALLSQEKTKGYALYGGLALTLLFGGFMFNRYKKTNRQKIIIEQKEKEASFQKALVENKNKEILDSISYAKRLQEAILPPTNMWKEALQESFILYKPKDIVAGDFYWLEFGQSGGKRSNLIHFTAADCTGHGVPGAMVSVVCANALSRTVNEFQIEEPGKILDKVRELVIQTFEKSESEVKDGMDISLCTLNTKTLELMWAGANNPLWLVRKSSAAITEIKGDKQPVGSYSHSSSFITHKIKLERGDCIYIFTDGFADQFGGDKGKKFKSSKMKELILSVYDEPMQRQLKILGEAYESWRGGIEQVDDVCVIGVRV